MSEDSTRLTNVSQDDEEGTMDLSRYLAKYEVTLVVLDGPHKGAQYPIRREKTTIGRSSEADLTMEEDTLSRVHAAVVYREGTFYLEDLDSANGTLVDGKKIREYELRHGERFKMGHVVFQFLQLAREVDPKTHVMPTF